MKTVIHQRSIIPLQSVPGLSSRILSARLSPVIKSTAKTKPNDFMQVLLDGIPRTQESSDRVELLLTDGTRVFITGENSVGLVGSILKDRF